MFQEIEGGRRLELKYVLAASFTNFLNNQVKIG